MQSNFQLFNPFPICDCQHKLRFDEQILLELILPFFSLTTCKQLFQHDCDSTIMASVSGRLKLKKASDYYYLNQSDCLEIHNIDDAHRFHILMVIGSSYICMIQLLSNFQYFWYISIYIQSVTNSIIFLSLGSLKFCRNQQRRSGACI